MFQRGLVTAFRLKGIPIRFHWSIPIAALFISRFEFRPVLWIAFFGLILWHELGHALLVWRRGLQIFEVQVHGLGGVCVHARGTPLDTSIIAWGGVLAQALILLPAWLFRSALSAQGPWGAELSYTLIEMNLFLIGLNLIPIPPFDGAEAWKLFSRWSVWKRGPKRKKTTRKKTAKPTEIPTHPQESLQDEAKRLAKQALEEARQRD